MSELTPPALSAADSLLRAVLEVSLTALAVLRPVYAAEGGELHDFALEYLNPAAQRLVGLGEQPGGTMRSEFPATFVNGVSDFYQQVFETGRPGRYDFHYHADGFATNFQVTARRHEDQLVVSFNADGPRAPQPNAAGRLTAPALAPLIPASAAQQRSELARVFGQAPVAMSLLRGPEHIIELANARMGHLWGRPVDELLGQPHFTALPDLAGQGFEAVFEEVYRTGNSRQFHELSVTIAQHGQPYQGYFNIVYQPSYDGEGRIFGIIATAVEVTEQVRARQQTEQLNEELEMRVTARSAETRAALFEAEQQREQLRQQQALLGQILGQVPAAVATLSGPQHRFTFFNDLYQNLVVGRAVLGRTVLELMPEVEEQGFVALLDQVYATGQSFVGAETQLMLADPATGQLVQRYMDFVYQPLFDGQQQPQGILVFVVDVTEQARSRKQAATLQAAMLAVAQRQAQSRQDLYQVFEQTPVAIVLLREPDHRIDYFNPGFAELFPPEEWSGPLHGHTLAEVYPRIKLAGLVKLIDEVYRTGEPQGVLDLPLAELQPGSPRFVTFAYQPYHEQGRIVGVAAFVYDTTEQVLARRAVEATAQQLRLLTDALPVLIGYLDHDHIYRFTNQAYQAWFNQDPAALLGRPVRDVVGEAAYAVALPRMERALAGERVDFDARMPYREGFVKHIHTSYIPDVQGGKVRGFYTLVTDVTEQVLAREQVLAANAELNEANSRLSRTNADLDTFVYTASHDLKSPITNVEGLLLALREHLSPEALTDPLVPRLLEMMDGAVTRFQQTLTHLTDVSRLQQTMVGQPTEEVDLCDLVEAVRLDMQPELTAVDARITLDLTACPTIHFPAKNLRSIIYNLLSNAVKYHAPDRLPEVAIRCTRAEGRILLSVQDNGLGLTPSQQGDLFQMFRRLHNHVPGSGVGLYMVKKLVENAGGSITVESEAGVGSTFTVALPVAGRE